VTGVPGLRRLDQGMAADAVRAVPQAVSSEMLTRFRQLPVQLRTSGLAATLAFLLAKSGTGSPLERAYGKAAEGLTKRVAERLALDPAPDPPGLLARLADLDIGDYQLAAAEAQAFAGWMRRIAEGRPSEQPPAPKQAAP
jgi:CRISPR type III-B/RAMP module-associated protein Cmr5